MDSSMQGILLLGALILAGALIAGRLGSGNTNDPQTVDAPPDRPPVSDEELLTVGASSAPSAGLAIPHTHAPGSFEAGMLRIFGALNLLGGIFLGWSFLSVDHAAGNPLLQSAGPNAIQTAMGWIWIAEGVLGFAMLLALASIVENVRAIRVASEHAAYKR